MAISPGLCTICVRAGSKGVAGKNTRLMHGRPLLAYSIEHAKRCDLFDCIAVSSDSTEILEVALAYGADVAVHRPADLATDVAAKLPAIRHCAEAVEKQTSVQYELFVDLDVTSPLREAGDIVGAVNELLESGSGNVITGTPAHRSPYFNMVERQADGTIALCKPLQKRVLRRQDAPQCFDMNASIYVWRRKAFFDGPFVFSNDTRIFVMPPERSIAIDDELDWDLVEFLMGRRGT